MEPEVALGDGEIPPQQPEELPAAVEVGVEAVGPPLAGDMGVAAARPLASTSGGKGKKHRRGEDARGEGRSRRRRANRQSEQQRLAARAASNQHNLSVVQVGPRQGGHWRTTAAANQHVQAGMQGGLPRLDHQGNSTGATQHTHSGRQDGYQGDGAPGFAFLAQLHHHLWNARQRHQVEEQQFLASSPEARRLAIRAHALRVLGGRPSWWGPV